MQQVPQPLRSLALILAVFVSLLSCPSAGLSQTNYEADRDRALQLFSDSKLTEALPLLEKLAKEKPTDAEVTFGLGFCLLAKANTDPNIAARKGGRKRAREILVRAQELGFSHPLLHSLLEAFRPDGEKVETFSDNKQADEAMQTGEAAFVQGDFDQALAQYKKALEFDPRLYEAALFVGDMYNKKGEPELGTEWFAKAVAINPYRETAYRYWGVGLMKQGKKLEARDKFIEAYITEPFNRLAVNNLVEWGSANEITVDHPQIDIPANVVTNDGKTNITIDDRALTKKNDRSAAWMMYALKRSVWANEKFAKTYPAEKTYRHSLAEEVDGLRAALSTAGNDSAIKLEPSLAVLWKLNEAGLLESYVLLAQSDQGIARDYPEYLKTNRDKLRRYVVEYVLTAKQPAQVAN
jgi:tetratricopeptide (TPR) repeat protein